MRACDVFEHIVGDYDVVGIPSRLFANIEIRKLNGLIGFGVEVAPSHPGAGGHFEHVHIFKIKAFKRFQPVLYLGRAKPVVVVVAQSFIKPTLEGTTITTVVYQVVWAVLDCVIE